MQHGISAWQSNAVRTIAGVPSRDACMYHGQVDGMPIIMRFAISTIALPAAWACMHARGKKGRAHATRARACMHVEVKGRAHATRAAQVHSSVQIIASSDPFLTEACLHATWHMMNLACTEGLRACMTVAVTLCGVYHAPCADALAWKSLR